MGVELGRIVHANSSRVQQRFIDYFNFFDCSTSLSSQYQDNSFVLSMTRGEWEANPIIKNDWVFMPGTEYGGRVKRSRNVAGNTVEVEGYTTRGWMSKWVIQPTGANDYLIISAQDANAAITALAQGRLAFDYFAVSGASSGIAVSGQYLHQDVYYAINDLLASQDARMSIVFDDYAVANIEAVSITDYSRNYDFSQDYGAKITSDNDESSGYNCIVAYGQGDLHEREKVVLYWVNGAVTAAPPSLDLCDIREYYYDDASAESTDALTANAKEQLEEIRDKATLGIDLSGIDIELHLGDIVGARDRITGLSLQDQIYTKIMRIEGGKTTLNYMVKGDAA